MPDTNSQNPQPTAPALVLEGGGFRGMFTAGVLDVLMERGLTDFQSVWGTSAGAMNAVSFKSGQIGRTMRVMLAFRDDKRFMSFLSFAKTGDMTGGEFVYDHVQNELDPCDNRAFEENPMPMWAVASDVTFGTAGYLPVCHMPEDAQKVRASASARRLKHRGHRRPPLPGWRHHGRHPFWRGPGPSGLARRRGARPREPRPSWWSPRTATSSSTAPRSRWSCAPTAMTASRTTSRPCAAARGAPQRLPPAALGA